MFPRIPHVDCRSCGAGHYSSRKGLSHPCPLCGSEDLTVDWHFAWMPWAILLVIVLFFVTGWLTS